MNIFFKHRVTKITKLHRDTVVIMLFLRCKIIPMKKLIILFVLLCSTTLSAQIPIDNKGSSLQSYPNVTTIDTAVQQLIEQVSITILEDNIRYMQNLGIRSATSPIALEAQNWLVEQFESYGDLDISLHYFPYLSDTLAAGNVVVLKQGSEFPDEYILISSHYDHQDGPGADDNASGTAGVLECARILSQIETKRSILFIPFNCEEFGLVGSFDYAQKCANENMNILGVFNLDQIGYFPKALGDIKMGVGYSHIAKHLFDFYFQVANLYIPDVPTFHFIKGDHYNSDNTSFNIHDYAALYISDSEYDADIPCYHRKCDTLGNGVNSLDLGVAFVKATLAATAELANGWLPPQNVSAVSGISKVTISWDKTPETETYKLYKNGMLLTETEVTNYEDFDVMEGNEYAYFITAKDSVTYIESAPSNIDTIVFTQPLPIPYFNNFETCSDGFIIRNDSWVVRNSNSNFILSNAPNSDGKWSFSDNYYNILEMQWFSIPEETEKIRLKFDYNHSIGNSISAYGKPYLCNTTCYLEITTDRKTWHKLAKFQKSVTKWKTYEVSLNEYIGSPFVQIRFRFESFGPWIIKNTKQFNIDNVLIDFSNVGIEKHEINYFKDLKIYPNPTNGVFNVITNQENSYEVLVFDMLGKQVFHQVDFKDGSLDLSSLQRGSYFLKVSNVQHGVARKIVIYP